MLYTLYVVEKDQQPEVALSMNADNLSAFIDEFITIAQDLVPVHYNTEVDDIVMQKLQDQDYEIEVRVIEEETDIIVYAY